MFKNLLIILCLVMICIPSYSMTYEEYQGKILLQQAREWQERVANSPKRNGRYYNHYCKSKIRGIGVKLQIIDGNLTITGIKKDSIADKKGLKVGQVISKVNGRYTKNSSSAAFWGEEISMYTPNGIPEIEVDGVEYAIHLDSIKNIDYKEIAPKVYLDLASINIKKGAVFFWIKYLKGNELIPIKDKNIYYFEDAYVIDYENNKYAMIERSAFDYDEDIIWQTANANNADIAKKTGWTHEILGYNPNADYSALEYEDIPEKSAAEYLKQIILVIVEQSKKFSNTQTFQSTLRYY